MPFFLSRLARTIQNATLGRVSKSSLLTRFLPLSFVTFFGAMFLAASAFPTHYDWQKTVISKLSSPLHNPDGSLLAAFGVMAATALVVPFAGYVARHLGAVWPRLGKWAGISFGLGFALMFLSMVVQSSITFPRLHETLARAAAAVLGAGMICCFICGVKDRCCFGGKESLPPSLAYWWGLVTVFPIGCLAILGIIFLLGQHGGQAWAEDFRQSFRHTPLWHLAFWEWIGASVAFIFLTSSAALLPVRIPEPPKHTHALVPTPSLVQTSR